MIKKISTNRKGFITFDAMIGVGILSLLVVGLYQISRQNRENKTLTEKRLFLQSMDIASIESFKDVIDSYIDKASNFSDSSTEWGWNNIANASPFPIIEEVGGIDYLKYELDKSIGKTKLDRLRHSIASNYQGACYNYSEKLSSDTDLYLYCPLLVDVKYDTPTKTDVDTPFTKGTTIDPNDVPIMKVTYKLYDTHKSSYTEEEYDITYSDVYNARKNLTSQKIIDVRNVLEDFATATKLKEVANEENDDGSGGLNNADDEMVGWHWKSYGDDKDKIRNVFCDKASGGGECSNLNTNDIWRSGTNIKRGLIAKRVADNFLGGVQSFFVDGFNNGIYIHPNGNDCSGSTDLSSCNINSLTIPQDDYITIGKPPYTSYIYIDPYKDTTKSNNDPYGRIVMTY